MKKRQKRAISGNRQPLYFEPEKTPLADYAEETILEEVRRVARLNGGKKLTKIKFDRLSGRVCSFTITKKLGSWRAVLERAGVGRSYAGPAVITDKMHRHSGLTMTRAEMIADLRRVYFLLGKQSLRVHDYDVHGLACAATVASRFGSWTGALGAAHIPLIRRSPLRLNEQELLENLAAACRALGRFPYNHELLSPVSRVGAQQYVRHWGSWRKAQLAYVAWAKAENRRARRGGAAKTGKSADRTPDRRPPIPVVEMRVAAKPRRVSLHLDRPRLRKGLRYVVFRRDGCRCQICGAAPGPGNEIELEIDHIVPVSKGGGSEIDNLQTVCSACNRGKGARSQEPEARSQKTEGRRQKPEARSQKSEGSQPRRSHAKAESQKGLLQK